MVINPVDNRNNTYTKDFIEKWLYQYFADEINGSNINLSVIASVREAIRGY